jgi:transcriptional regulator with XRE-family HTH domain
MLKNPLMESLRKGLTKEEQAQIDDSFALADRIAYLLKKHEITQRQLAERLGKRESEVSKWLSGSHNFTQSTLTKISCAIGESIYLIPDINHQIVEAEITEHLKNVIKATITRLFKESTNLNESKFEPYSKELSRIEITKEGAIYHPVEHQSDGFYSYHLNPINFKMVEKESAI